jgi:hypothetical protein
LQEAISDPVALSSAVMDSIPFLLDSLAESVKQELGHQKTDTIPTCFYREQPCPDS